MRARWLVLSMALTSLLGGYGCAPVALTLFGVGAGVAAATGVSYTLDGIAYETFTTPVEQLQSATIATLNRMDIKVKHVEAKRTPATEPRRTIEAVAGDRKIEIELEELSSKTTRMRVNVKRGMFLKDRATATEIIVQTEKTLEDKSRVAQSPIPASSASGGKGK